MSRVVVSFALLTGVLLTGTQPSLADEPKPEPPNADASDWERETQALEARAAQAEANHDLPTALDLREQAVGLLREKRPESSELAAALNKVAATLFPLGRAPDTVPLLKESLAMFRRLYPGDHPDVAAALNNLAAALDSLGRSPEALPLQVESLAMMRRLYPADHGDLARSLNNLAHVFSSLGRAAEALPLLEESLAMRRRLHPSDHPDVVTALNNLAGALESLGRASEALTLLEESLAMSRRLFAGDHPYVAKGLSNVAIALQFLGRTSEAIPLHEESLAMSRRLYRDDHPDVASSLNNLAKAVQLLGRASEALLLHEESLAMCRRLYPGDHPLTAVALNGLAAALDSLGRASEALPLHEESLAMCRRLYPGDHPYTAVGLNGVAATLDSLGRAAEALPLFEESLAMYRRVFPRDHPDVALGLNDVASALEALGRLNEAFPLREASLAMFRRLYPGDHPEVARGLNNLAATCEALGRVAQAFPLHQESLSMYRRLYPDDHPDVARGLSNLAGNLASLGRPAEALPLLQESLAMRRRLYPDDHPQVAIGLNNLAATLVMLGHASEALPMRQEAYEMSVRLGSPNRWRWGTALGSALLDVGRASEAGAPLETAVDVLEGIRSDARGLRSEERSRFVDSMRGWSDPYEALARAHVALGGTEAALGVVERGRGREMLDLLLRGQMDSLAAARTRAREQGDEATLAELERVASDRAAAEAQVIVREKATQRLREQRGSLHELRLAGAAESEARRELLTVLSRGQRLVRDNVPAAKPLAPKEMQALLAPEERLLAYLLGSTVSYAFVVSRDAVELVPLTGSAIDEAAEAYLEVLAEGDEGVLATGRALFEAAVPEPVWRAVKDASRLYLMADGALQRVPFETLVVGETEGEPVFWEGTGPPIAYEPSASVLAWLRSRPRATSWGADLVAVGDPVFAGSAPPIVWPESGVVLTSILPSGQAERLGLRPGDVLVAYDGKDIVDPASLRAGVQGAGEGRDDIALAYLREGKRRETTVASGVLGVTIALEPPNVAGPKLLSGGQLGIALRSATERGRRLRALPGTRKEVAGIAQALRERMGEGAKTTILLGSDATESRLLEATHSPRFLHLATHGLVDETETASFSALALTMPTVPVAGDDGFLTLVDLFSRWRGRLDETELVVLSACESTKGREQRGESMYALPWGFLYAGARAVVGSLWAVDDDATAYLMAEFYRRLLATDGQDVLAALSAARQATRAKYPHPGRWGAFVLSGAPR